MNLLPFSFWCNTVILNKSKVIIILIVIILNAIIIVTI